MWGGDYPLVLQRNPDAPIDLKVLLIKDSYMLPVQAYMSTCFREMDILDLRHFTECSAAQYVERNNPDIILMMINPSQFSDDNHFLRLGELKKQENKKYDCLVENFKVNLSAPEDNDFFYKEIVNLEHEQEYMLTFDDVKFISGKEEGVCVSVYDKTQKKVLMSKVFDIEYCKKYEGFQWIFDVPKAEGDEILLILYAGVPETTGGVSVEYQNITIKKMR